MRRTRTVLAGALPALLIAMLTAGCSSTPEPSGSTPTLTPVPTATPSPTPTPTPTPTLTATPSSGVPSSFVSHSSKDGAFAIAFPGGWTTVDLSGPDSTAILENLAKTKPEYASAVAMVQASGAAYGMMAMDTSMSPSHPRIAATMTMSSGGLSLDFLATTIEAQPSMYADLASNFTTSRTTLAAGPALEVTFGIKGGTSGLASGLVVHEYLLVHGERAYMLVFDTVGTETDADRALYLQIASSFAYTD